MNRKIGTVALVIAITAWCFSVVSLVRLQATKNIQVQYVMYLGTNGKDSNQPVCTPDEAKITAANILADHFGGYTIQEANGGWKDNGKLYQEYTLVIYLSDTTLEAIHAAADELLAAFDQSSILIHANTTKTEFYSGKK